MGVWDFVNERSESGSTIYGARATKEAGALAGIAGYPVQTKVQKTGCMPAVTLLV